MPRLTLRSCLPASGPLALRNGAASPRTTLVLCVMLLLATMSLACGVRTVEDRIINRYGMDVNLRSEKKPFSPAVDHGYAHPSDISVERLTIILGSLQIDRREGARTVRGPALPAEILSPIAQALAESFREADSSQRIALSAQRKQMQKAIFNRKFLTSLVTWMEGDELIVHLSRSDWPIDEKRQTALPEPQIDDPQQKFRVVTNEFVRRSGRTGVAIDWQSDVFKTFAGAAAVRSTPLEGGVTAAPVENTPGEKSVLMEAASEPVPAAKPLTQAEFQALGSADLRALADLEDQRDAGQITEREYQQKRQAMIDAAIEATAAP